MFVRIVWAPATYPQFIYSVVYFSIMGRIDAVIPDELEKKLRMKAVEEFGGKKGSLTDALEAAIQLWVGQQLVKEKSEKGGGKKQ